MIVSTEKKVVISDCKGLDLDLTLDCGQCFRWSRVGESWQGIVGKELWKAKTFGGSLIVEGTQDVCAVEEYFDLGRDYDAMQKMFSKYDTLKSAVQYAGGIRILKQNPWEALITFILSQNNNIPRIMGLVQRLCENFGEPIEGGYAFPTVEALARLNQEDLSPVRAGFRARYIVDAAQKVFAHSVELEQTDELSLQDAEKLLMQIVGVGKKVADCTLLFGCHRLDAFPVDVWIDRAMKFYFPNGLDDEVIPLAGVAQQYLFHYIRTSEETQGLREAEREFKRQEKQNKEKSKQKVQVT